MENAGYDTIYKRFRVCGWVATHQRISFTEALGLVAEKSGYRRFLFVPFDQYIEEEERNYEMNTVEFWEETGELSGILNMVIRGLLRVVQNKGFTKSRSSDEALEEYKFESDSVLSFMQSREYVPCEEAKVKLTILYEDYVFYCRANSLRPVASKNFTKRLRNMKYVVPQE